MNAQNWKSRHTESYLTENMKRSSVHLFRSFTLRLLCAIALCVVPIMTAYSRDTQSSTKTVASKVALIHFNPKLHNLNANIQSLNAYVEEAFRNGANIVVAPELTTSGYSITLDQVMNGLGLDNPFIELSKIRGLAIEHRGYVFLGLAERQRAGKAFNSVVVFGPKGLVTTGRKRGIATWNTRGDVAFDVITTPFGDLGTIICSDSYLPDWLRILTLKGADIILSPANWWGGFGQEEIWQTRARENGIWMIIANRWGSEVDDRFTPPYTYNMNDAPSDVINPDGTIVLSYRAQQESIPVDKILYYTVHVPANRIGNARNSTYTVAQRRPEAYQGIANLYYRPDLGNQSPPNLPPAGVMPVGAITYVPSDNAKANLANIQRLWGAKQAETVVLPGLGITPEPIDSYNPGWAKASPWIELQEFVDKHGILLLVTTVRERFDKGKPLRESVLVIQQKSPARLFGQIHNAGLSSGTGQKPTLLDLPHARVAVLTGLDALFPELSTHLVKEGVDLVMISSGVDINSLYRDRQSSTSFWNRDALIQAWKTSTNHGFHLAASDSRGFGLLIQDGGGFIVRKEVLDDSKPAQVFDLDSAPVRQSKHLNAYYPFDLSTLLSVTKHAVAR
jgi:predicted amidohydrolase